MKKTVLAMALAGILLGAVLGALTEKPRSPK